MADRAIAAMLVAAVSLACSSPQRSAARRGEEDAAVTARSIEQVLAAHTDSLMSLPGVVGTAIGMCDGGERCIKVLLDNSSPEAKARIPTRLEGFRVATEVSGTIRPR